MRSHRIMVCATSPMLKSILSGLDCDEDPSLIVPDATVTQVASLLSLIYSGEANLYQRFVKQQIRLQTAIEINTLFSSEIDTFVNLTHLLKMVSIPARIVEKSWGIRFPASKIANASRISKAAKRRPGRPPKSSTTASTLAPTLDTEQSVPPPTKVTRSGRKVVPRRLQDEIVGDVETADVLGYSDEVTGIVHVTPTPLYLQHFGSVKSSPTA